jgi:endoglucanase
LFDLKAHLRTLTETHAPSGHEAPIREVVRAAWRDLTDDMQTDGLGSLIGVKYGTPPPAAPKSKAKGKAKSDAAPRRKIMLAAHMDEIGLMVADIIDGFIAVHRISGVDNRLLPAQPMIVHGRRPLPGIVATTQPHLLKNSANRYQAMDELLIDVGLPAEEVASLVQIGDLITPDAPMIELLGQRVAGKAMDDRACLAAVTLCLHELSKMQHLWDVYAVATVQEETGLFGAKTAAYQIAPDIAIALDVTFAPQPGIDAADASEMNGGVPIGIGPNFHPKLVEKLRETAKRHEIKAQDDFIPGASGTDAWAIQVAREGIPTALLEVPIRNMHSTVETADMRDIERAGRLMARFITELDADFLTTIAYKE